MIANTGRTRPATSIRIPVLWCGEALGAAKHISVYGV
jgi:hypothetical protein